MTAKIKKIFSRAKNDELFLKDILHADGDKKPGLLSSDLEDHLFSITYYGWYVGRHGVEAWHALMREDSLEDYN